MRKKFSIALVTLFFLALSSVASGKPPVKKVHAHKQAVIPGIVPRFESNEINFPGREKKENYNYWFYLELYKSKKIQVTGLWINGKSSTFKTEPVKNKPVKKIIYSGATNNDTIIMMPATRNKVLLLYPSGSNEETNTQIPEKAANLVKKNELVIQYLYKGKTYYSSSSKINLLPPDARS